MKLLAISADGFRCEPQRLAQALVALPGFEPRAAERDGRRVRGSKDLPAAMASALKDEWETLGFDFDGRDRNEFAITLATRRVAPNLNSFDLLEVHWPGAAIDEVRPAFIELCSAARAEFGFVDPESPGADFAWPLKMHHGVPCVGWVNWFGPQFQEKVPAVLSRECWAKIEQHECGVLAWAAQQPEDAPARRDEVLRCLGPTVTYPRAEPIGFDLSKKNIVTPAFLLSEEPPPLPKGFVLVNPPSRKKR